MPSTSNGHRQSTSTKDLVHDSMISFSLLLSCSIIYVGIINVSVWNDRAGQGKARQAYIGLTFLEDARSFLLLGERALINKVFAN